MDNFHRAYLIYRDEFGNKDERARETKKMWKGIVGMQLWRKAIIVPAT